MYCIAASPSQPGLVASGDGADTAHLWDASTGEGVRVLTGHTDTIIAVAFNHNGTFLATGSLDATVRVWNVADGVCVATCEGPGSDIEWIAWHPKGDVLLAGSTDGTAWMWHIRAGKEAECMMVFAGHTDSVTCGTFTGNGKSIATGSADGTVRIWNPRTGACLHTFTGHGWHSDVINTLECASDKPLMVTGSQDGSARLSTFAVNKVLGVFSHGRLVASAKASEEGASGGAGVGATKPEDVDPTEIPHPSIER